MFLDTRREDSELGSWTHLEYRPPEHRAFVESVWLFNGRLTHRERYYPTGTLDLLFQLGTTPSFRIIKDQHYTTCPPACLTGMLVSPLVLDSTAHPSTLLGVRLRPAGATALFRLPLYEVTGTTVSLEMLTGQTRQLIARLNEAASDHQRIRIMTQWIAARLAEGPEPDGLIGWAVEQLEHTNGRIRIAELIEHSGVGAKHFVRRFERHVGVKPKTFARIVRFRSLAQTLLSTNMPLGQAALIHGYYDQAHMNAEFRQYAGTSPHGFRATLAFPGSDSIAA